MSLTRGAIVPAAGVSVAAQARLITDDRVDIAIRHAIGGDKDAISWIVANADTIGDAVVIRPAGTGRW
jgi:hypothetical protein